MDKQPPWYGGNKIPASYLAKFSPKTKQDEDLPYELRLFLNEIGADNGCQRQRTPLDGEADIPA